MDKQNIGTVVQVIGPVLDIRFADGALPEMLSSIEIQNGDRKVVAEVAQHIGDNVVRCIAMSSTDGRRRGIPNRPSPQRREGGRSGDRRAVSR